MRIRDRAPSDDQTIGRLNNLAFGGTYESALIDRLRTDRLAAIELVAVDEAAELFGHILFSRLAVSVDGHAVRALALAPMSVRPDRQRCGIGGALVRAGLGRARSEGWQAVIVLGHADYYPRFGFTAERACHLAAPFRGPSFMALDLVPGTLDGASGSVDYPAAFGLAR